MNNRRQERLNSEIIKVVSTALREIRDPNVSDMTTLTEASITNDFSFCDLKFSVMGSEREKEKTIEALQNAEVFFKSHIAKNIRMRKIPELRIKLDESIEYSSRINEILKGLDLEDEY